MDHLGPKQSLSTNQSTQDYLIPRKPRLPNQLRKISAKADNRHHLARSPLVSSRGSLGCPPILQRQDHCRSKSAPPFQGSVQKMLGVFHRETSLPQLDPQAPTTKHFSSFSPLIPRPCKAQRQDGSPPKVPQGEPQDLDLPGCPPRANSIPTTPLENRSVDRCVFIWMGCSLRQRSPLPGTMVQGRDSSAYQRPGSVGSDQDNRNLKPQQPTHFSPHRQRGGEIRHQQPQIESPSIIPSPIHAMSSQVPQPQHHGLQDTVVPKPVSGRPQQGPPSSDGMVTPSGSLRQDNSLEGSSRSGPNGNDSQQEGRILCIPPSSPSGGSHRRVNSGLEQMESSVCLPPEDIHDATSPQAPLIPKPRGPRSSLATSSSMVPRTLQKGRRPFAPSRPARTIRTLRKSLKWLPKLRAMDRLHFLKEVYTASKGATVARLPGPRLQKILHQSSRDSLEGI